MAESSDTIVRSGPSDSTIVRREQPHDIDVVSRVEAAAFETSAEAELVNALRGEIEPFDSWVAEIGGEVVGHALWTPVHVESEGGRTASGRFSALGPVAVLPEFQRRGVGSQLIRAGQRACFESGSLAIFVLGHPDYYPRFGFEPAASRGIRCSWEVPENAFMVATKSDGVISGVRGIVRYHPRFDSV